MSKLWEFLLNYAQNVIVLKFKTLIKVKIIEVVYFPLPPRMKFVQDRPSISVSSCQQWSFGQKLWFGWLSAISQLASMGVGGSQAYAPHTVAPLAQVARAGKGGLCSLPLGY